MLSYVSINFLLRGLHLVSQLLLSIGLRQDSRLLEFYLQFDRMLPVNAGSNCATLPNENLSQLAFDLLKLLLGNLAAGKLRIFGLRVVDELIKLCLISGLFEKVFYLLVSNVWTSSSDTLRLKIIFSDNNGSDQIKLTLYVRLVCNTFGASLFSHSEQLAQVRRKLFSRRGISGEPTAKL